jgi:hypothetical protein
MTLACCWGWLCVGFRADLVRGVGELPQLVVVVEGLEQDAAAVVDLRADLDWDVAEARRWRQALDSGEEVPSVHGVR